MKKPSRLDYAYAVGRVRALEKKLVSRPAFLEAAEEKNLEAAIKVIFDAGDFPEDMVKIQDSSRTDAFLDREKDALETLMSEILLEGELEELLKKEENPEEALPLAEHLGYAFIIEDVRHRIDLGNLKIFCRLKYSTLSAKRLEALLMRGGSVSRDVLLESFPLSYHEVGERLAATPYQHAWNTAVDALQEKETFIDLEREFENFLMAHLKKAKHIVFGPEPLYAYALAKRREIHLIRILAVGKIHDLPAEIIKQRISETYV